MQPQMISHPAAGGKSACARGAPTPRRKPIDPHQLPYPERGQWEDGVKTTPGVRGSRMLVLRVILDYCHGKPWAYPSDATIAGKTGLSLSTVSQCLTDLADLGVIRIVRRKGSIQRYLVIASHPHAAAFLAEPGTRSWKSRKKPPAVPGIQESAPRDPGIESPGSGNPIPEIRGSSEALSLKPGDETPVPAEAGPEMSPSGPNDERSDPEPVCFDWRKMVADLGGSVPVPAPKPEPVVRPVIDPAERDAIVAEVLSVRQTGQDHARETDGPGVDKSPIPPAGRPQGEPITIPADLEAETIKTLSQLGPGAKPGQVLAATARLTALFGDPGSRAFYVKTCNEVARGQLPARVLVAAVGSARGPGVRNPGAAFTAHIKRCRAAAESRRQEMRS